MNEIEIKQYVEIAKKGKLISIDTEKKEFLYSFHDLNIKSFFENVEDWTQSLLSIGESKYDIVGWWKDKNEIELSLLREGERIELKKETEKAFLITNNKGTDIWIPKSLLTKMEVKE